MTLTTMTTVTICLNYRQTMVPIDVGWQLTILPSGINTTSAVAEKATMVANIATIFFMVVLLTG